MDAVYERLCPNCGGPIRASRLEKGLPCNQCLVLSDSEEKEFANMNYYDRILQVYKKLSRRQRVIGYLTLVDMESEVMGFSEFFKKLTGFELWSAQRTWARRLLSNESFAIVAPTGVGKTTLLTVYSIYAALRGKKVYFIAPTNILVEQIYGMFNKFSEKINGKLRILAYTPKISRNKNGRLEFLEKIQKREYDILITTSSFLSRNYNLVKEHRFNLIIVDDVDAILRTSKNIERILNLLGFNDEIIEDAQKLAFLKINLIKSKASGNEELVSQIAEEISEIEERIYQYKVSVNNGQLILSSATGRARGIKVKIFKELLGFEVGGISEYMRNIADLYDEMQDPLKDILKIYKKLGPGGLIFVSKEYGKDMVKKLATELKNRGIRVGKALSGSSFLDKLHKGEIDLLIGVASYYGVMVRGIDEPLRVKYAIFIGIPKHVIPLEKSLNNPWRILQFLMILKNLGISPIPQKEIEKIIQRVSSLKPAQQLVLRIALMKNENLEGKLGELLNILKEYRKIILENIKEILRTKDKIVSEYFIVKRYNGKIQVLIPDIMTYIQASGRTSRLYKGSMTFGVSIIFHDDEELLRLFEQRMKRYFQSFQLQRLRQVDFNKLKEKIIKTRSEKEIKESTPVKTALLVVESPTKAKTIAKLFGKPARRRIGRLTIYEVPGKIKTPHGEQMYLLQITASYGHLTDLTTDDKGYHGVIVSEDGYIPVFNTIKRCLSCGYQFTSSDNVCPRCGSTAIIDSIGVIKALQKLALEVGEVYIATDPDVEGEKIAWDLFNILKPYNDNIKRLEIYEITRRGLEEAFMNPRSINRNLVKSQLVRRITDRWIGFSLSKHLWKTFDKNWLGAGRVQTPVLGWVIDRYNEWRDKRGYRIIFITDVDLRISLFTREREEIERIKKLAEKGFKVINKRTEERVLTPLPPYTTDELLRDANRYYGYSADRVMKIAQELFESGLITYHRTDSIRVSNTGIKIAKQYISNILNKEEYFTPRTWSSEGAHEAIRPTNPLDAGMLIKNLLSGDLRIPIQLTKHHLRIYDLIFKRFIASQMKSVKIEETILLLDVGGRHLEIREPSAILEEGFNLIKPIRVNKKIENIKIGDTVNVVKTYSIRTSQVSLYTHGDIIGLMKKRKLGRPSTYAKIISSIRRHGYVIESKRRKYLIPTNTGIHVYKYLSTNFPDLVSEDTTRALEEQMELVEKGLVDYKDVLETTYMLITSSIARIEEKISAREEAEQGII